jgi:hypothetical protein
MINNDFSLKINKFKFNKRKIIREKKQNILCYSLFPSMPAICSAKVSQFENPNKIGWRFVYCEAPIPPYCTHPSLIS